ncbi:bacterio-opsin activator domain-containing protein [Halorubrum sp. AD140]|uniref:helix-turn-helix domain-containing protein n=1 Tax=Halorubrum sp. AD140 TaxID=3050073 RepID=UPI002ACCFFCB|nr:bacterio-opsin activator domain-containing protein [Halorubrum sp. AD140]MDZ5809847.1 bacterio-opsin activator domain-containing protein [Halorubrum sp. AD140]
MASQENGSFVELEFSIADDAYPVIRLSRDHDCEVDLLDVFRPVDELTTAFFHVTGGQPNRILRECLSAEHCEHADIVDRYDHECVLRVSVVHSVFSTLARANIPLQSMSVSKGDARLVATVPPDRVPSEVIDWVKSQHPAIELRRRQPTSIAAPFVTRRAFQRLLAERLTDRQWNTLRLAFERGYFERPRRITQEGIAEELDLSPSTVGQHLHTALRKLLYTLFSDAASQED